MTKDALHHRRYITLQIKECEEHRYFMAEQASRAIGDNEALFDWAQHRYSSIGDITHAERFCVDYERNHERVHTICNTLCGQGKCLGKDQCPLNLALIHRLLGD